MQISSVGLFMCLAVVCVDSFLPPMSFRKLTLSSSSPIIAPCVPWQQPVACSSQRNRKEVPEFGRPNVSRYEDFYTSTKFETVDADSRVLNDGQSEESTNPFSLVMRWMSWLCCGMCTQLTSVKEKLPTLQIKDQILMKKQYQNC